MIDRAMTAAAKSDDQQCPQVVVGLDVHELADEHSNQQTPHHVHEQRSNGKSVRGKMLDPATNEVAEDGARRPSKCNE